jgi:hypothetical protein
MRRNAGKLVVDAGTSNTIEELDNDNFGTQIFPHPVHLQPDVPTNDKDHFPGTVWNESPLVQLTIYFSSIPRGLTGNGISRITSDLVTTTFFVFHAGLRVAASLSCTTSRLWMDIANVKIMYPPPSLSWKDKFAARSGEEEQQVRDSLVRG